MLHLALGERGFLRRQWRGLVVMSLGAAIFLAPLAGYFVGNPHAFMSRTEGVSIFTPANLAHLYYSLRVDRIEEVIRLQAVNSLTAFNLRGETTLQYGRRGPLLDFVTGPLFVLGAAMVTLRLRQSRYFLLAAWFWLTIVVGSILTIDALSSLRTLVLLPAILLMAALALDAGWRGLVAGDGLLGRVAAVALVAVTLLVAGRANVVDYFEHHVVRAAPAGFYTILARHILATNDRYRVYLIARPELSMAHETPAYLAPGLDGVDVRGQPLSLPLPHIPRREGGGLRGDLRTARSGPTPGRHPVGLSRWAGAAAYRRARPSPVRQLSGRA